MLSPSWGEVDPPLSRDGDVEDPFAVTDYLKLYNWAFKKTLIEADLGNDSTGGIPDRIESVEGRFNHALPAHTLTDNQDEFFAALDPVSVANFEELNAGPA